MTKHMTDIGTKLKLLRENANLTQKQIAKYLSIDRSLVSKIEKGECSINSDTLNQLSTLYGCPVSLLISNDASSPAFSQAFKAASLDFTEQQALSILNKIALNQFTMDQLDELIKDDKNKQSFKK